MQADYFRGSALGSQSWKESIETAKAMGGAKITYKKADIVSRTKQPMSMMPPGLHAIFTTDELVNVAGYLFSLKEKK
jgi:hypothetical protein